MGFKKKVKHYVLQFEDEEYDGFECVCGSLSVDEFIEITSLSDRLTVNADPEDIQRLFDMMSDKIIRWNLEDDDDKPIGHDPASLRAQDFEFIMMIQMSWMSAIAGVPTPLPDGSNNGGTTPDRITTALASMSQSRQS